MVLRRKTWQVPMEWRPAGSYSLLYISLAGRGSSQFFCAIDEAAWMVAHPVR
jgi:hypothetical protein